jgi:succinate dehydrogenase/fumarate reductase cytochrome b subunit
MRFSGVAPLGFVVAHLAVVAWLPFAGARLLPAELTTVLDRDLSATYHGFPLRGVVYLFAAACAAFHLGAGVWGQLVVAGRAVSGAGRARSAWIIGGLSTCVWLGFANVVVLHATGAALLGGGGEAPPPAPCPAVTSTPAPPTPAR